MQIVAPEGIKNPIEHGEAVVHSGGIDQAGLFHEAAGEDDPDAGRLSISSAVLRTSPPRSALGLSSFSAAIDSGTVVLQSDRISSNPNHTGAGLASGSRVIGGLLRYGSRQLTACGRPPYLSS